MANFFQWQSKHPEYKPLYYVCGEEMALRLEVIDAVQAQFAGDRVAVEAKQGFAAIERAVLTETSRLRIIVVSQADKLKSHQIVTLSDWAWRIVRGELTQTVLILHTEEINPDTALPQYRPFVDKGRFVECKAFTVENMKKYAMQSYPCTEAAADLLIELVSYNFRLLNNELEKLVTFETQIDEALVRDVVVFSADDMFLNYMLRRSREQAIKVVSAVPADSIRQVLNTLARKLAFLYLVVIHDAPGMNVHKLAATLGVQPWQLLEFFAIKRYWNGPTLLEKLKLLTTIESHYYQHSSNILLLLASWW